jgi:hypothetical protein
MPICVSSESIVENPNAARHAFFPGARASRLPFAASSRLRSLKSVPVLRVKEGVVSPELETLDQLLDGHMPLQVIRALYPDDKAFADGIQGLLRNGDVQLLSEGTEVPPWRWRELFEAGGVVHEMPRLRLAVTDQGARRVS